MMSESVVNNTIVALPLTPAVGANASISSSQSAVAGRGSHNEMTLYDKLNHLSNQIAQEIIGFHSIIADELADNSDSQPRDSYTNTILRREEIQKVINDIKDSSFKERSPEASFNIKLFDRYSEMVNTYIVSQQHSPVKISQRYSIFGELPSALFEHDDEHLLVGLHAIHTKICKIRVANVIFSIIAFSIMASVPFISENDFCAPRHFQDNQYQCTSYRYGDGCFNFRPYQLVIASEVLVFVGNCALVTYYMLPIDSATNRSKYIPGLLSLLNECRTGRSQENETILKSICLHIRTHWKLIELCVDGILFALSVSAFIASAVVLGEAQELSNQYDTNQYYTLHTLYLTFSSSCLSGKEDPTIRIQASLWMLFLSVLCSLMSCLIVWRTYRDSGRPLKSNSRTNAHDSECKVDSTNEYITLPQVNGTAYELEAKL